MNGAVIALARTSSCCETRATIGDVAISPKKRHLFKILYEQALKGDIGTHFATEYFCEDA
jgi:hypothetical protein